MYSEKVIEEFKNPKNMGEIKDADAKALVGNPVCGDSLEIFLKVENNKIIDAKVKTFGCVAAIATSSIVTQLAIGKTIEEAEKMTKEDIIKELGGLPTEKVHCSLLGLEALKKAIYEYKEKKSKT